MTGEWSNTYQLSVEAQAIAGVEVGAVVVENSEGYTIQPVANVDFGAEFTVQKLELR